MNNISYIALSRQTSMRREMDVLSNNLANMNTTGFKGERVMFEEYLQRPTSRERISFVRDFGTLRDLRDGRMQHTTNPLDVAINGRGYLVVDTPQGQRYTRDGRLQIDLDGRLVTATGHPLLDVRGQTIQINSASQTPPVFGTDGSISVDGAVVARLDIVSFDNEQNLRKTAAGLLATTEQPRPSASAKLVQGMTESSNIEPIVEMGNMIELVRQYQSVQTMIDNESERQQKAIDRLAKVA